LLSIDAIIAAAVGGIFVRFPSLVSAFIILVASSALLSAQSLHQPGEVAYDEKVVLPPDYGTASNTAVRKPDLASVVDKHDQHLQRIWISSMVAMASATAFDAGSSWHKRESNSLLASPDGTFAGKGLAIKASIGVGVLAPQIIFRKHKDLRSAFSIGNFAEAGIFTGTASHNLTLPSAK
jgi:hypothetical protein